MNKFILLFLLSIGIGFSQRTDTLYQTLTTNYICFTGPNCSTTVGTYTSPNVNSIGQANHTFISTLVDDGANTCFPTAIQGEIQYSYDGVNYMSMVPVDTPILSSGQSTPLTTTTNGYGVYPYVRIFLGWVMGGGFNNTHCKLTVNYSGSLQTIFLPFSSAGLNQGLSVATGVGTGALQAMVTVPTTFNSYANSIPMRAVVYGIDINNGGSSDTSLFGVLCGNSGLAIWDGILKVGEQFVIPPSPTALCTSGLSNSTPPNNQIQLQAVPATVNWTLWYRFE